MPAHVVALSFFLRLDAIIIADSLQLLWFCFLDDVYIAVVSGDSRPLIRILPLFWQVLVEFYCLLGLGLVPVSIRVLQCCEFDGSMLSVCAGANTTSFAAQDRDCVSQIWDAWYWEVREGRGKMTPTIPYLARAVSVLGSKSCGVCPSTHGQLKPS
ncbi:hypothetical protein BDZ89DRAFT_1046220 [Hymenopellis radicata]|nr:hypothetical protein BDZ89DRAFT_1046220 [Hymenopellis radicata]